MYSCLLHYKSFFKKIHRPVEARESTRRILDKNEIDFYDIQALLFFYIINDK